MDRRTFTTWLGVSLLASASPVAIKAIFSSQAQLSANAARNTLKTIVFYVAPNGNDRWSGKRKTPNAAKTDGPFATLARSRNAIRTLKRQQGGELKQPVTVLLRGGTYFLNEPLVFTPEDSGTTDSTISYQAYRQEKPIISGGRRITGWKRQGKLWVTNLPDVKNGKWYFRLLRTGDKWATRARYPNFDPKQPLTGGWLYVKSSDRTQAGAFNVVVGRIHNIGDRLEWTIVAPVAGKYQVWVRYAHNMKAYGLDSMDDRTAIRVGDRPNVLLDNLPDTGSFSHLRWAQTATIELAKGKQKLTWENLAGGGLGLDAFCLSDDPNWSPTNAIRISNANNQAEIRPPRSGKHLIVVQAETYQTAVGAQVSAFSTASFSDRLTIATAQFPKWQNWEGAEIHTFMRLNYGNSIIPISRVDKENYTVLGNFTNANYPIGLGNRFFIENVREALDSPGEWYLDRTKGELVYWATSPKFPRSVEVVAPALNRLIVLQGDIQQKNYVQYINFRGLTFIDTNYTIADNYLLPTDAAIWLTSARQCVIADCTFTQLGGYAVRMEQRSHQNQIIRNTIAQLGQGGVLLLSKSTANQPYNNLIAANNIHDCGQIYKHVAGVYVVSGSDNRIAHNRIYRMPRYAISLKSLDSNNYSHDNILEFNEIVDTSLETSDTGAIETLGRDRQPSGNIIRFNLIGNVVGMDTTANGQIISPAYSWGIYLDDRSSGTTVYGNIVIGTLLGAVFINGGKDNRIENNIFVNGRQNQIQLQAQPGFTSGNIVRRNIFFYQNPQAKLWQSVQNNWRGNLLAEVNHNLYWNSSSNLAKSNQPITPEGNFAQWQASGLDRNSAIANPLFVNPSRGDFRLRSNSPAFTLGFQALPTQRIGIKGFQQRNNS